MLTTSCFLDMLILGENGQSIEGANGTYMKMESTLFAFLENFIIIIFWNGRVTGHTVTVK